MNRISFSETQRFRTWWAWGAVLLMNILFLYAIIQQIILGKPFGTKPAPDYILIVVELFLFVLFLLLISIKLKTRITDEGIYYRFYPFHRRERFIGWNVLSDAYMREYNSFHEYGGWGIRTGSPQTGNAINTSASSKTGLQLRFTDGRLLLVGTSRPEEVAAIIKEITAAGKLSRNG